jgi:hypothetical protein
VAREPHCYPSPTPTTNRQRHPWRLSSGKECSHLAQSFRRAFLAAERLATGKEDHALIRKATPIRSPVRTSLERAAEPTARTSGNRQALLSDSLCFSWLGSPYRHCDFVFEISMIDGGGKPKTRPAGRVPTVIIYPVRGIWQPQRNVTQQSPDT